MKEITVKTYKFDELSDKAKEEARQWWREGSFDDSSWSNSTIDEVVEQGKLLGIDFDERQRQSMSGKPLPGEPKIWWSGFSSQGDGACFEGTWRARDVKADEVAKDWGDSPATTEIKRIAAEFSRIAKDYPQASFNVVHYGHYSHENCTLFNFEMGHDWESGVGAAEVEKAESDLEESAKDFMRWIYSRLEADYQYQNSDEHVDESIRINEYLFTESGSRSATL